jgi:hypothetical protein
VRTVLGRHDGLDRAGDAIDDALQPQVLVLAQVPDEVLDMAARHDEHIAVDGRVPAEERRVLAVVVDDLVLVVGMVRERGADEARTLARALDVGGHVHGHPIRHCAPSQWLASPSRVTPQP